MAEIKSFTDIPQSKKLAEFLPSESADVIWDLTNPDLPTIRAIPYEDSDYNNKYLNIIAAWSLTALLSVLEHPRCFQGDKPTYWFCGCFGKDKLYHEVEADNPIDACVVMIIKLHKLNLL